MLGTIMGEVCTFVLFHLRIQRVRLIDLYTDDTMMDGRLLPSRLQKRVAASIQHRSIALSLLREEKTEVS